jgi:hypothetical protein
MQPNMRDWILEIILGIVAGSICGLVFLHFVILIASSGGLLCEVFLHVFPRRLISACANCSLSVFIERVTAPG